MGSIMRHACTTVVSMQVPYGSPEPRNESMNDRALPSVVCPRAVTSICHGVNLHGVQTRREKDFR